MTTRNKYEAIKEEYDSLRKRYDDLITTHSSTVDKLELAQVCSTNLLIQNKYYDSVLLFSDCI